VQPKHIISSSVRSRILALYADGWRLLPIAREVGFSDTSVRRVLDAAGVYVPYCRSEAAFWNKIKKTDGCWEWQGKRRDDGRGVLMWKGKKDFRAHRLAYMLTYGPIPEGLDICHSCDNPPCCRPDHLFAGTRLENVRDAIAKGRAVRGERVGNSKLGERQVREIRDMRRSGTRIQAIATAYGVSQSLIHKIVHRKRWRHLP